VEVARLLVPDKTAWHSGILLGPQADTGRPADTPLKGETRGAFRAGETSSQEGQSAIGRSWNGAPGAIRTPDLLVRSQVESNPANLDISAARNSFRVNVLVELC